MEDPLRRREHPQRAASVIDGAIKCGKIDVVLVGYNFSMGSELDAAIDRAKAAGIGVVAMKVMAGGFRRPQPGDKTQETLKRDGAMVAASQVGAEEPPGRYHHPQHDRHGAARRQFQGDELEVQRGRPEDPQRPSGAHRPAVLPHVRPLRRDLLPGLPVARRAPVPHLRGWLRTVRSGPRTVPRTARQGGLGPLPGLLELLGRLPPRSARAERLSRAQELFA